MSGSDGPVARVGHCDHAVACSVLRSYADVHIVACTSRVSDGTRRAVRGTRTAGLYHVLVVVCACTLRVLSVAAGFITVAASAYSAAARRNSRHGVIGDPCNSCMPARGSGIHRAVGHAPRAARTVYPIVANAHPPDSPCNALIPAAPDPPRNPRAAVPVIRARQASCTNGDARCARCCRSHPCVRQCASQ